MPLDTSAQGPTTIRRRVVVLCLLGLLVWAAPAGAEEEPDWRDPDVSVLVSSDLDPVDIAIAPDGQVWWNDRATGNVTRWNPETGIRQSLFATDPISNPIERGLVGLALDPDHDTNGVFYVYYTVVHSEGSEAGTNHLSRVEDGREQRLLEVPAYKFHNGGRIEFDDEGRMFVSTGENGDGPAAQDPNTLLGKILHLHPNGTPAEDTMEGYVYSMGHRNVYGMAYDAENDRLFATENGADEDDEVNLIEAGANYGWPHCQGYRRYAYDIGDPTDEPCENEEFEDPIGAFYENRTVAPTGATMFHGDLYWAAWKPGEIHRMSQDPDTGEWNDTVVYDADGRITDIETHEGAIYYSVSGERIVRLDGLLSDDGAGSQILTEAPAPGPWAMLLATATAAVRLATSRDR